MAKAVYVVTELRHYAKESEKNISDTVVFKNHGDAMGYFYKRYTEERDSAEKNSGIMRDDFYHDGIATIIDNNGDLWEATVSNCCTIR